MLPLIQNSLDLRKSARLALISSVGESLGIPHIIIFALKPLLWLTSQSSITMGGHQLEKWCWTQETQEQQRVIYGNFLNPFLSFGPHKKYFQVPEHEQKSFTAELKISYRARTRPVP